MAFTFGKLIVYQNAISFADSACGLTEQFPRGGDAAGRRRHNENSQGGGGGNGGREGDFNDYRAMLDATSSNDHPQTGEYRFLHA